MKESYYEKKLHVNCLNGCDGMQISMKILKSAIRKEIPFLSSHCPLIRQVNLLQKNNL